MIERGSLLSFYGSLRYHDRWAAIVVLIVLDKIVIGYPAELVPCLCRPLKINK